MIVTFAQEMKLPGFNPFNPEGGRPRSIILIRLRARPTLDMPAPPRLFNGDPVQMFNDMIRRFQENTQAIEQSIRQSLEQNGKELPKPADFGAISSLVKNIPIVRVPGNVRADSSSESSEESNVQRPFFNGINHRFPHAREHERPAGNRLQQFVGKLRSDWGNLLRKQPKIPIWIFIGILLSSSLILWCK